MGVGQSRTTILPFGFAAVTLGPPSFPTCQQVGGPFRSRVEYSVPGTHGTPEELSMVSAELGRCYCGIPEQSFRPDGSSARPYPGQVYLVFVNDEKVTYNWRWEKADPDDPRLPVDHETRFKQRLL